MREKQENGKEIPGRQSEALGAFQVRAYNRCARCGRPRGYFRKFGLCRICLRDLAHQGVIPGVTKASW